MPDLAVEELPEVPPRHELLKDWELAKAQQPLSPIAPLE